MLAASSCPACLGSGGSVLSTRDGKTGEPLVVVQCAHCGLGHVEPMPSAGALEDWYARRYRQDYKAALSPRLSHVLRAARIALERWDWASGRGGLPLPARALDIGASSGEWVYLLGSLGVPAQGIEPNLGYWAFARESLGLDVMDGTLQQRLPQLPAGDYDLVSLFHVLEHLPDPLQALRGIRTLLAPQGRLFIEVPDAAGMSSPCNTFFRAHTLYFSAHSLRSLALAAGFEVAADNFREGGNLRVLLRAAAQAPDFSWQPCDALSKGQQARRWSRYLWQRLKEGHAWRRHLRRLEEKRTASRHTDAKSLLDATYARHVALWRQLNTGRAHPPDGS